MLHYHIRWSNGKLDWEAFDEEAKAKSSAENLVMQGESYTIEAFDGNCSECGILGQARTKVSA
jgi:hypothetical protein